MKIPRTLGASDFIKLLKKVGYQVHHQTGSHIIVKTEQNGENTQSIPNHRPLKIGTLNGILGEVADHLGVSKVDLANQLFNKRL